MSLPITSLLPALFSALEQQPQIIIEAPPGAGKSTALPLALLQNPAISGKILLLEPRRLAARNIARYLAKQLGEEVGQRVGLRMRGEQRVSQATQLEIVTEGVLTRQLQRDPELSGISLLIFDEFHERSLHADTALALALEAQQALRPDLRILILSATLSGMALPELLPEAAQLHAEGRSFPIAYHYRPISRQLPLAAEVGKVALEALANESGSLLVFLPGEAEINQLQHWLRERVGSEVRLAPLYGRLDMAEQQAAIAPAAAGVRKVVLATNVAETSLTIEGIRVVIDSGLERRALFDLNSGMTRLETRQISRASATQRAGRAGRVEAGVCYRLWREEEHERLAAQSPAEIELADLAPLLLEALAWGTHPNELRLLTPPSQAALAAATQLLQRLGALNDGRQLTAHGRAMAALGSAPRLAHLLLRAQELEADGAKGILADGCALVALTEAQRSGSDDLQQRWSDQRGALAQEYRRRAEKFKLNGNASGAWWPLLCALAWPDRIAKERSEGRYQLSGGQTAELAHDSPLRGRAYLCVSQLLQTGAGLRITLATPLEPSELERYLPELFSPREVFDWDERSERIVAERQRCLGELVLSRTPLTQLDPELRAKALLGVIRRRGLEALPWSDSSRNYLARLRSAAQWLPEANWPVVDAAGLLADLENWLLPALNGMSRLEDLKRLDLVQLLKQRLDWPLPKLLDEELPSHFTTPTGSKIAIHYREEDAPLLPVKMQEMFGQATTPKLARGRLPLVVDLLSPAQRPLQRTSDLAAFWQGAYQEVKKEMKGRYPRHYWPDNPLEAEPTRYTKKRAGIQ